MMSSSPTMLTIKETADKTGLAEHYIRQLVINHEINCLRAGRKYLVNYEKLIEYLDDKQKQSVNLEKEKTKMAEKKQSNTATENKTATTKRKRRSVMVDVPKLRTVTEEKGYTTSKVCNILGITTSTYWNWEHNKRASYDTVQRIAKLLDVNAKEFIIEDVDVEKPNTDAVESTETVTADTDEVESVSTFKEIGDTQNVHVQFDTINSNVILLSNVITDTLKEYIDKKFEDLYAELSKSYTALLNEIQKSAQTTAIISTAMGTGKAFNKEKPKAYILNRVEINKLLTGFNENDSYEKYKEKINRMVTIISQVTKAPHKNILHGFYIEMTNVYGVVYDQLKKEYYRNYQRADGGSTELIYENPIFRQIFYNIISDKLKEVTAK